MSRHPRHQTPHTWFVLVRKRNGKKQFFWGESLVSLLGHVEVGERFLFAKYERGAEQEAIRTKERYGLIKANTTRQFWGTHS